MATILIVDDHVLNRQFLMVLLGHSGHSLIEAADGAEGLQAAGTHKPDLIISDILMPHMDGYEFVARLRDMPTIADTPVMFYTAAYHEHEARAMAATCGVRWILPKPSGPETILRIVHEALGLPDPTGTGNPAAAMRGENRQVMDGESRLSAYFAELEASRDLISRLAGSPAAQHGEEFQKVVQQLSDALSSLQGVSLRLTALIDLGIELTSERDPQHLLETCCRVVQDICAARFAGVGLLGHDGHGAPTLERFLTRGMDEGTLARLGRPAPDAGVFGEVLRQRRPLRLGQLGQPNPRGADPATLGLPASHPPVRSLMVVPVASQEQTFGWIYLADKLGGGEFSEVDERAASTVASQLAVVYDNLLLYGEIQQQHVQVKMEVADRKKAQETLRRTLRARTVMAECNHVMVHATDEATLLQDMCRAVVESGGYRMAWIGYTNPSTGVVTRVAQAGTPPAGASDQAAAAMLRSQAEATGGRQGSARPWVVMDVTADTGAANGDGTAVRGADDFAVSLPLKNDGKTFGVLTIYESEPQPFDSEHLAMLEELADDISYGVISLRTKAAREAAEAALLATEEKLSSILDSIDNVVWSATQDRFLYLNSKVETVFGRPLDAFYRDRELWFDAIHPQDRAAARQAHASLVRAPSIRHEYRVVRPDGEVRWVEERARAIRDEDQKLLRFDGVAIDISERKAYEARIEYLADHDALTGLANRNLLSDRVSQAMAHARRNGGKLALMFLDLDRFKGVNDSFGHQMGDLLLLEVAARLKRVIRDGDTVARQGGDEFTILLTDVHGPEDATAVADKIFHSFASPIQVQGRDLFVTTSIGITLFPEDGEDIQVLLRNADIAMYRAKEERGNALQFYSREMSVRAVERAELEGALRRAIERKEFELFYQPKVQLQSGRIIGAEALIRWRHPEIGLVSPTRFIPMAEELGLIVPIGDWVLRTACAQNKAWQDAGLDPICVSVNLSARQFRDEHLVDSVADALDSMGLDARHLELELTESMVMNGAELFISKLRALESMGVQLSIDDFGTGYSSLSYLKRFPLHHLKIDQSFVRDIANDLDDATITSSVISLGHSLNLKVIAEGVETAEQVEFLRRHKCDEMQGNFFSKPLPADDFFHLLQTH
ncbi:EAL domain-containing protein [Noviherbaspirillum galbum]|uniref:EAL domain-containing protein n=1 Tax=Noviherbaspirillum galbum TaxID=2709383 RepID=A0A6B3SMV0_9BURK|nr:EAL domain-containing protein [Noviherbaspirillum galbum]NEX61808.1 EAL domain-containing protein [Noviherbaspirillum galbum]